MDASALVPLKLGEWPDPDPVLLSITVAVAVDSAALGTIAMIRTRVSDDLIRESIDELQALDRAVTIRPFVEHAPEMGQRLIYADDALKRIVRELNERIGVVLAT